MILPDHILFGTAITQLTALKDKWTIFSILLMSILPDIDILFGFPGTVEYLKYHRIYTHNIFFGLIVSVIITLLLIKNSTLHPFKIFSLLYGAFAGHLLLDSFNSFGLRFLYPLNEFRFDLSLIFEFNIIFSLLLYGAVGFLFFVRVETWWKRLIIFSMCLVYVFAVVPVKKYRRGKLFDREYMRVTDNKPYQERRLYPWIRRQWRAVYQFEKQYCLIEKIDGKYKTRYFDKYPPSYEKIKDLEVVKAYRNYTDSVAFIEKGRVIEMFSMRYPKQIYTVKLKNVEGKWTFAGMSGISIQY